MNTVQQNNVDPTTCSSESREPLLGVTLYERVTAMLVSLMVTLGGVTLAFGALWMANQKWDNGERLATILDQPILEEDYGGILQGRFDDEFPRVPGVPDENPTAADNPEQPTSDTPELNQIITELVEQVGETAFELDQVAITPDIRYSYLARGSDGSGQRGPLGDGPGGGKGGVAAAKRWEIVFEPGVTELEYARQLDFFRVELATVAGDKLYRVSNLASPRPSARVAPTNKKELFFQWRDAARRAVDLGLLRKATEVPVTDNSIVLHFYPRETELKLRQLESDYAAEHGRPDLRQVAKTRFIVKRTETGYDFVVAKQTYLVQQM
jgi:hypothetical protein